MRRPAWHLRVAAEKSLAPANSPQPAFLLKRPQPPGRYFEGSKLRAASTHCRRSLLSYRHGCRHVRHPQCRRSPHEPAGGGSEHAVASSTPSRSSRCRSKSPARDRSLATSRNKSSRNSPKRIPSSGGRGGGLEVAKSLLQKALGTNAGAALDNIRQSIEAMPFGFLRNVDQPKPADLHHRRASANDRAHHVAPAAQLWRGNSGRPARRARSSPSSAASPRWARPTPRSFAKSKRASSAACRA